VIPLTLFLLLICPVVWMSIGHGDVNKGNDSAEMEEERRNCFVAITRTKEQLTLSTASQYRGYAKRPSRFITEMGLSIED
jgi:superfamily I DNA/RNA helicase